MMFAPIISSFSTFRSTRRALRYVAAWACRRCACGCWVLFGKLKPTNGACEKQQFFSSRIVAFQQEWGRMSRFTQMSVEAYSSWTSREWCQESGAFQRSMGILGRWDSTKEMVWAVELMSSRRGRFELIGESLYMWGFPWPWGTPIAGWFLLGEILLTINMDDLRVSPFIGPLYIFEVPVCVVWFTLW